MSNPRTRCRADRTGLAGWPKLIFALIAALVPFLRRCAAGAPEHTRVPSRVPARPVPALRT